MDFDLSKIDQAEFSLITDVLQCGFWDFIEKVTPIHYKWGVTKLSNEEVMSFT